MMKTARRLSFFFITLLLMVQILVPIGFATGETLQNKTPKVDNTQRVFDDANLFTEAESSSIAAAIADFEKEFNMVLVVATRSANDSVKKTEVEYADDFYDYNKFNIGGDTSGALFLIDMKTRQFYISTTGKMIAHYTDTRIENALDTIETDMVRKRYGKAGLAFVKTTRDFVSKGDSGSDYYPDIKIELPEVDNKGRVFDLAGLYNQEQKAQIEQTVAAFEQKHGMAFIVVTRSDESGDIPLFTAAEFFSYNNFQKIDNRGSLMLLIDTSPSRECSLYVVGEMQSYMTLTRTDLALKEANRLVDKQTYADIPQVVGSKIELFIENGVRETGASLQDRFSPVVIAGGAIAIALVLAGIVYFFVSRKYTVKGAKYSYPFREKSNLNLTRQEDVFINTHTQRVRIKQHESSGGGSSTHSGSSGSSHGGGGRGF